MQVLQIGHDDWSDSCQIPAEVEWQYVDADQEAAFDVNLLDRPQITILDAFCDLAKLQAIDSLVLPYRLVVAQSLVGEFNSTYQTYFKRKVALFESLEDRQEFTNGLPARYFEEQFGQKLPIRKALVSPLHKADAWYEGNCYLATNISFESGFHQLIVWKQNIPYESHRVLELWPEFIKGPSCEIELVVQLIQSGTADVIAHQATYSQAELAEPVIFSHPTSGYLSCSVFAKGNGLVKVGPIHYRHSRLGLGQFLPGGERIVDSQREELFYYFHPGNLRPPLIVYFGGFRQTEGFEGYHMMAGLDHPFLLVSDPRLEGGRFYLGSDQLEGQLRQVIHQVVDSQGFSERDAIFSGLAMGAFGALYYGSQFNALAIVAGKPIIDLGYVAKRGRLVRPNDFFTIFDIVNFWNKTDSVDTFTGELIERWNGSPGFGDTQILMSYMEQDDYDDRAYYTLLGSQTGKPTKVIARGYQGRHNDDNPSVTAWFTNQLRRVMSEYLAGQP
ncbi:MAG: accessory Sec system protein Asp2 [Micrococcales bacterium]|nr:accessory Sec system protein Asp2 [Micrococcales bacterium]